MILKSVSFATLPIDASDVRNVAEHLRTPGRIVHDAYHALSLIDANVPPRMGAVLAAARSTWAAQWLPALATGWCNGRGEGLLGRLGGVAQEVIRGRRTIVRDLTAIMVGYAMLTAAWIGLGSLLLGVAISTAEAAASTASGDIARRILVDALPVFGAGTLLSQGLARMALVMSIAATTLAGISAIWQAGVLLVDYTSSPDAARRHSPWFFCLRIAVGVGLLVPLSGGYGVGQVLVGNLARWGSDKASEAWSAMATSLSTSSNVVVMPDAPPDSSILMVVRGTAALEACRAAINADPARNAYERVRIVEKGNVLRYDYEQKGLVLWTTEVAGGCGTVTMPNLTGSMATVGSAHIAAWQKLRKQMEQTVGSYVATRIACRDSWKACTDDPNPATIGAMPESYRTDVSDAVASAWSSINADARAALSSASTTDGWIGAGKWTHSLATLQGSLSTASTAVPRVTPPTLQLPGYTAATDAATTWVSRGLVESGNRTVAAEVALSSGTPGAETDALLSVGNIFWSAIADQDAASPLTSLASTGYKLYGTGTGILVVSAVAGAVVGDKPGGVGGSVASAAAKMVPGGAIASLLGSGLTAIKSFLDALGLALIVAGLALAYLVPALPFIRFYFAILGWIIAVFETVLLVPVLLVLMITSEAGGGIFGTAARACVLQIVGLTLRPLMSICGLVVGLIAISAGISILNQIMLPLMRDVMQGVVPITFAGFVSYAIIYTALAYITVNICTKSAEALPQAAYRWLGATATADADHGTALSGALGWLTGRLSIGAGGRRKGAR